VHRRAFSSPGRTLSSRCNLNSGSSLSETQELRRGVPSGLKIRLRRTGKSLLKCSWQWSALCVCAISHGNLLSLFFERSTLFARTVHSALTSFTNAAFRLIGGADISGYGATHEHVRSRQGCCTRSWPDDQSDGLIAPWLIFPCLEVLCPSRGHRRLPVTP